ncbi:hypothetical protein ON010_g1784 [Phytophthora cinnamomi]|nr:hypothetical protein ON010_g1784 [Phytophthora cinnamomi]
MMSNLLCWDFGIRGRSVMHFGVLKDTERRHRVQSCDMSDFSHKNKLPKLGASADLTYIATALSGLAAVTLQIGVRKVVGGARNSVTLLFSVIEIVARAEGVPREAVTTITSPLLTPVLNDNAGGNPTLVSRMASGSVTCFADVNSPGGWATGSAGLPEFSDRTTSFAGLAGGGGRSTMRRYGGLPKGIPTRLKSSNPLSTNNIGVIKPPWQLQTSDASLEGCTAAGDAGTSQPSPTGAACSVSIVSAGLSATGNSQDSSDAVSRDFVEQLIMEACAESSGRVIAVLGPRLESLRRLAVNVHQGLSIRGDRHVVSRLAAAHSLDNVERRPPQPGRAR